MTTINFRIERLVDIQVGNVTVTGAYKTAMNVVNHPVTQVAGAASVLPFGVEANIDNEKKWMDAAKRVAQSRNKEWSSCYHTARVFKFARANYRFWFDLVTKNLAAETASLNLTATNGIFSTTTNEIMGGSLWRDGICYSTTAVSTHATNGATVTVRRKALDSLVTGTGVGVAGARTQNVIFTDVKSTTTTHIVGPILVRRPDNDTFEIFLGQWVDGVGVRLYKSVLSELTDNKTEWNGTFSAPTLVATLTSGGVPSFGPNVGAGHFGVTTGIGDNNGRVSPTGYYDVALQRYYFPCYRGLHNGELIDYGNLAVFCPGYVFNEQFEIVS